MPHLLTIDDFDSFKYIRDFPAESINDSVLTTVVNLNEKTQLEPFIRNSIYDLNDTPHGPMEIVDILTTKVKCQNQQKYSAFILKGKSFKRINAQDVSHQIYRLKKINGLEVAVFAYTGNLLDQPQEEFIATCNEINCDYSIWNNYDISRLLVSEGFICPKDGNIIEGNICQCGYNPRREQLNTFQEEAIKELKVAHDLSQTKGLVILPTGSGKTRVAAVDIKNHRYEKVLYVAHTYEILNSAIAEFNKYFEAKDLKLINKGSELKRFRKINFTSIQLLNQNIQEIKPKEFDYFVVDEFHHASAKTYRKCISHFENVFLLGLTATPFRADHQDIYELCDGNIIVNYELRDGIDSGILSPYDYWGCFDDVDYSNIRHNGISYDIGDLEKALILPERDNAIIKKWKEKALNKPTIGFCCSQLHARRCCENFNAQGIKSALYISSTSTQKRKKTLLDFSNGKIKIIFTVDVLNEGVDFPFVECLLFMRPTESRRIFLQQLGRGLRRFHGKTKTIVLDFIGNFVNSFRIIEYFGLSTTLLDENPSSIYRPKSFKDLFNLPQGCEINFDERVIAVFSGQAINRTNITRHNIHRILIQQFLNLCIKLNKVPTWKEIDRNCILGAEIYKMFYRRPKEIAIQLNDILNERGIEI